MNRQEARGKRQERRRPNAQGPCFGTKGKVEKSKSRKVETWARHWNFQVLVLGWMALPLLATGCASHFVNPWRDELSVQDNPAVPSEITTPSVEAARASGLTPTMQQRAFKPDTLSPVDEAVTHGPLYFEDPYESPAGDDGRFAWRGADYWYMVYGPSRWMVSGLLFPVSALAMPPWMLMESDGAVGPRAFGERHDARRAEARGPEASAKE